MLIFYPFLERVEKNPELKKRLERKMREIIPIFERDIEGGAVNTPK